MKRKSILSLLLFSKSLIGFCTVWTVNNSGSTFSPATLTISPGDSVNFILASIHNAVEVDQSTWNSNGSAALSGGFQTPFSGGMVLPAQLATGTHYYVCTNHVSGGMKGTIIVLNCSTPAQPGTISGNTISCSNNTNTYSITTVSSATSYTWTLPSGWSGNSTTNSITTIPSTTSGTISVTANNNCGSSLAKTFTVTANNSSVSASGSTLTANAAGANYVWINCTDNTPISGQTNKSFTATSSGNYAVIVTQNTCVDTSACVNIDILGINETTTEMHFHIYPNPSNGKFNIINPKNNKTSSIEIFNLLGELIFTLNNVKQQSEIDLSSYQKGIYFVKIYGEGKFKTEKIIIN